ncbi:GNAT family N-acetyltransferase [Candidatus Pacearchaeota archaeon]|nr:GNAT family N-acetyltransferase [Candidatus Pacearchaeota archaeon]
MRLEIKKGKKMEPEILGEIDRIYRENFKVTYTEMLKNRKDYFDDYFFVLCDNEKIISTGRLRPVKIKFMEDSFHIFGISDIVSVIKGKGYGKKIMKNILKYLDNKKEIGIGFCKRNNSEFYRKCGFSIADDLSDRFIFKDKLGNLVTDEWDDDVIYNDLGESLIRKIKQNQKEKVWIPIKHW